MVSLAVERPSSAPPELVFARATDFANAPEVVEGITKMEILTDGPVGLGTKIRETRKMFGKEATEEMEVTRFEEGKGYTLECDNHGCHYKSDLDFLPDGKGGSTMRMTFEGTPLTFMAKVMTFLMKPMMKKMAKMCLKDLDDIAAAAERDHQAG